MSKQKLFFEVNEKCEVDYFIENENGVRKIERKEYLQERFKEAESMYEKVVEAAKEVGFVYNEWVQRRFKTDYFGAAYIIDKMREEGICGEHDFNFKASRILV